MNGQMEKEKIIEEMARDICECYCNDGTCFQDDMPCDLKCEHMTEAQFLYDKGYRKVYNSCTIKMQGESELSKVFNEFLEEYTYVKLRQGEWIKRENKSPTQIEAYCSMCGRDAVYQVIDNKWQFENFCPHCGAKMKGAE